MESYICVRCGAQFAPSAAPPPVCLICADTREAVRRGGQAWMTLAELRSSHTATIRPLEEGLIGISSDPSFAINQQALLVQTPSGNVLWDCIALLDDTTIAAIQARGGLAAIALSHPHLQGSVVEWSQAFGNVPIYVHNEDQAWIMRPAPSLVAWEGENCMLPGGLMLIRCGGHFPGSAVLHWPAGAGGGGALLTGDTIAVVDDNRYASFMWSYPNLIPLSPPAIRHIVATLEPYTFERLYGGWVDAVIESDAQAAVARSAARYITALEHTPTNRAIN